MFTVYQLFRKTSLESETMATSSLVPCLDVITLCVTSDYDQGNSTDARQDLLVTVTRVFYTRGDYSIDLLCATSNKMLIGLIVSFNNIASFVFV